MPESADQQAYAQNSLPRWYVVSTKPRQEAVALANLQRQSFQAFLPTLMLKKRRKGKWEDVVEPMFPGYLFIRVDPEAQTVAPIRSTIGVMGLVRFGGRLVPIPDAMIEPLQAGRGEHEAVNAPFNAGDTVRFEHGPFKGMAAVFTMQKGADRASVLLTLMGRANEVEVALDDLIKD